MKKLAIAVLSLTFLTGGLIHAAGESAASTAEKFYGKITSIDHAQKNVTVRNAKQQVDATFKWDEQTGVTMNKKSIGATDLKIGQSLMVSYVTENDLNKAKRISVRTPFKKSTPN